MFDTKNVEVKVMALVMMRIRKDQRSQDKQGSVYLGCWKALQMSERKGCRKRMEMGDDHVAIS
jgi:hypothetical protein